jgi:PAS domain S-box-containing protein
MEKSDLSTQIIRILIIEDNPGDTRLFKEYLKSDSVGKYEVYSSETLAEGLALLTRQTIDIIITDLGLPDSKGLETAKEILHAVASIPVIITTGLDDEKLGIESIKLGVQTYLVKNNITPSILIHSIKFSLERKKIIEELKKSKEENLAIVSAIPDLLFGLNREGVFLKYFSPRVNQLIKSPDKYLGKKIIDFLPSHLAVQIIHAIDRAVKTNELVSFEYELLLNETNRFFEFRILPFDNVEVLALVRDISKRKQAEDALMQSEVMFRRLLSTSPEAIIRMDLKSRITAFSDVAPVILGYENTFNLINVPFVQFISDDDKKRMRQVLKTLQTEGLIHSIEIVLVKEDESTFLGEISLALIEESDGTPNGYIAIIRDITSRKIMEMQLIHNARMLSLGEMAAGIAHEINQPLNIISITLENLMLEVLQNGATDKPYIKLKSEKIFDNITRMRNIIDHIRSFSREHDDLIHGMFDIHDGITNAISMISEQFRHREIDLVLDFDKNIKPFPGDIYKFEQVILNLLTNAKDAIEEKHKGDKSSGSKVVRISTHMDDKSIYVEVEDNGIGIKSAELEKVLMPFFTTKETGKGTGLGLSISYGIIKEMHGTIVIFSKRNTGTTIQITLPLNPEKPAKPN